MSGSSGIQETARLTASLRIAARSPTTVESLRPALLSMRLALKAQLHADGWTSVPLQDVTAKVFFVGNDAHLIALHRPSGADAMLVGGSADGAVIELDGQRPPLTMGVVSSTDREGDGCACYRCEDCLPDAIDDRVWACWQLAGVTRSADEWFIAYVPAALPVTESEQRLHNDGSTHDACTLCKLERWLVATSRLQLPPKITAGDIDLHQRGAAHDPTFCSGCRAGLKGDRSAWSVL